MLVGRQILNTFTRINKIISIESVIKKIKEGNVCLRKAGIGLEADLDGGAQGRL